jgi:hypothetical protein
LLVKYWERIEAELARKTDGPWRLVILESKIELKFISPVRPTGPRPSL